jgi:methylmalonyl-CoA mutase
MGDIQEFFVHNKVRNFYSVSISGYHIAEAGANPISQLAFTLSNGFTFVEAYLARGMHVDDFAPNLSFFFSNGMDPEYTVLGRVARGSGRSRCARVRRQRALAEAQVPRADQRPLAARAGDPVQRHPDDAAGADRDLRQLQQPAHQRVRRGDHDADRRQRPPRDRDPADHQPRVGLAKNENPNQGAFIIDELTDLVEEAVLKEFEAISERGGVLGAMETGYQRGKIQEESMYYEHRKHDGSYPIVGVNTFRNPHGDPVPDKLELARSTDEEKQSQLDAPADFHRATRPRRPRWRS